MHALTIDVEDYHNVIARDWLDRDGPPTEAVVSNTQRLLRHLDAFNTRATFFVLGEVAETFPGLIREIAGSGHELGVHGYCHRQVFKLTPETFRSEVGDAKARLEDIAQVEIAGHRAPAFSINPDTQWALEVLAELGFRYDSSIFPISGRRYGWPGFPQDIHEMTLPSGRSIIEAPLTTVSILGRRLPACGGGYLRHLPGWVTRWAIRRVQRWRPAIVYMHPYEIEVGCGLLDTSALLPEQARRVQRFHRLQLRNRHTTERKFLRLLREFHFAPLGEVLDRAHPRGSSVRGGT